MTQMQPFYEYNNNNGNISTTSKNLAGPKRDLRAVGAIGEKQSRTMSMAQVLNHNDFRNNIDLVEMQNMNTT